MKLRTKKLLNIFTPKITSDFLNEKPPFPKKAKIEITTRCDLKCYHCKLTHNNPQKEMPEFLVKKILQDLKNIGVEHVGLFWMGEPLFNKKLSEYIKFAKMIGIKYVFISTNGRMAVPERIKNLIASGIDSIKFSINYSTREKYYNATKVDAFDQVMKNLKSLKKIRGLSKKPRIIASSIFSPSNKEEFYKINSMIEPYVDNHYPVHIYGDSNIIKNDNDYKIIKISKKDSRTLQSMLPCWSLFAEPHINYDGKMGSCYCDNDEKHIMGDLKKNSLMEVWHSEKFVKLRRKHLVKDVSGTSCENCTAYSL